LLVKVAAGLEQAHDVPEAAKLMLNDALEESLGTFQADRHPYQTKLVDLIQGTLSSVEQRLQATLASAREEVTRLDETKVTAAATVQQSETKLEEQKSEVCKGKYALADIATAFKAARETVTDVKLGQEDAERDLKKKAGDRDQLDSALTDYFRPLLAEGSTSGDTMGEEKVDNLVRILKRFSFDESMMSALPTALLKEPGSRGPFDTMVLTQLEAEVGKRIAAFDAALADAEPAKKERAASLEKAEADFAEVKAKQLASAKEFKEARAEEERRQEAVQVAKKDATDAGKEARRAKLEADKCQRALTAFQEGPQAAFLQLRDRTAPAPAPAPEPEPAVEEEEVAAEEVSAEEMEVAEQDAVEVAEEE